jgi:hypothetical protein
MFNLFYSVKIGLQVSRLGGVIQFLHFLKLQSYVSEMASQRRALFVPLTIMAL